ncbi:MULTISPECIES: Lrp/AsnC family transcriptional regulator [Bacillota]|jgi:DNA-binding Lrp family transcriptional regulator|uniref:Lrp/AsnC family transcriptional regulator n=2 Tax=Amedibacillus TaxID=2749846 RepID=A0A7G9GSZ8_9FIRM|nr:MULTISPECIES: Lrp/AsnC family transcriptional regulator [Bacillota]QNM13930.1 Lrp/AsnC family transcriptional regulator [[Eubacterium] hominis]MCH4283963.1 Lrp/AsnC family transcriptional regulator [Amedibacillus hominis]RGB56842.1 Lrp/AsnC family transcriptional regulator [Absiella sp. AM22-9]RGB60718.1 Lrp/AsnC family transcriptional regulator [Absiella sp. AM10-20]RGB64302.1 Lrp/AsnC family transcriptional regulator [Absiella sp. AM09-45]
MKTELLLSLLETNARYSTRDLADVLLEDEDSVIHTMSDLEKKKIICGYHTIINWDKTNKEKVMALIEVGVTPERDYGYDKIAKNIYRYPEVDTMYLMSGKSEFIVIIYGKTMQEVSNFVGTKLAPTQNVVSTSTFFVLKEYKVNGVIFDEEEKHNERLVVTP